MVKSYNSYLISFDELKPCYSRNYGNADLRLNLLTANSYF